MDSTITADNGVRSTRNPEEIGVDSLHLNDEIENLISVPPVTGSSFTALLELPAVQAVKLLDSPEKRLGQNNWCNEGGIDVAKFTPVFPKDSGLFERASKFSVFAANSPEPSNSVKQESVESDSPVLSNSVVPNNDQKSPKRKEREKKVKEMAKKCKNGEEILKDRENLPYVHVRARRGQATDSHSLAERARREKINARMKLLQELVPGCNKISGTAMVLDEIINHVQSLQRQVEFLSMRLAAVNPRIDINLDSLLATELQNGSLMESNLTGMVMQPMYLEGQVDGNREPYQHLWQFDLLHQPAWAREDNTNFVMPQNILLSYDSSAHSASLQLNQLKMEL